MQQAKGLENYHQLEQIGEGSFGKVSIKATSSLSVIPFYTH